MPYLRNGTITERKPFGLMDFLLAVVNAIRIFVLTIFTTKPIGRHVDEYNGTKGHRATSGVALGKGNVHGMAKPASAGCSGGG
jgi:hypothetical protein